MVGDEAVDIVLGGQRRGLQLVGGRPVAVHKRDRALETNAAHLLCRVAVTSNAPSLRAFSAAVPPSKPAIRDAKVCLAAPLAAIAVQ
jgi:hypothetical protein